MNNQYGIELIGGPADGQMHIITWAQYSSGEFKLLQAPGINMVEKPDLCNEILVPSTIRYVHPGRNSRSPRKWVFVPDRDNSR